MLSAKDGVAGVNMTAYYVFGYICTYCDAKGHAPTQREIADALNITPRAVHHHFAKLVKRGYLEYSKGVERGIKPLRSFDEFAGMVNPPLTDRYLRDMYIALLDHLQDRRRRIRAI